MPIYLFEGMTATGSEVKDRIDAANEAEARRQLRARGYFVTRLQSVSTETENESAVGQQNAEGNDHSSTCSVEKSGGRRSRLGCLLVAGSLQFLIFGGVCLYLDGARPLWRVMRASGWVETPCTVISSRINVHSSSGRGNTSRPDSYKAEIVYTYEFGDRTYHSDRYDLENAFRLSSGIPQRIVTAHPRGAQTVCFVNPSNPAEAVLERGWMPDTWRELPLPLALVLFGSIGLWWCSKTRAVARQGGVAQFELDGMSGVAASLATENSVSRAPFTTRLAEEPLGH
jgi:hypothetical protein